MATPLTGVNPSTTAKVRPQKTTASAKIKNNPKKVAKKQSTTPIIPHVPPASRGSQLPTNWPASVTYLIRPVYSATTRLPGTALPPASVPSLYVKIRAITDPTHPAYPQCGLFATQNLQPGQWVLDYLGYVHSPDEADGESDYDLSLGDRELGWGVDARWMGNEGRFVNDYRGVSGREGKGANVVFSERWVGENTKKEGRERRLCVMVAGGGKIRKGEELLISYGKGFWKERGLGGSWDEGADWNQYLEEEQEGHEQDCPNAVNE
ncbi:hypothetical protein DFH27DRAFT_290677 [Peziza echinospora]|nr:hypothetical protein DFH27DRAFT_290677 [Peziza echinospora]